MSLPSKLNKLSYKSLLIIVSFLVIPIVLLLQAGKKPGVVKAGWFNDSWMYRKAIGVTGAASNLTDFQISFDIGTSALVNSGKIQSDCDDIRVTDQNGKVLPHWIEENNPGCNATTGADTKVWVKVPSIPSSDASIYVYYGNPSARNVENGDNVFEFFDDFSSNTTTDYSWATIDNNSPTNSHNWDSTNQWIEIRSGNDDNEDPSRQISLPSSGYAKILMEKKADYPTDNTQWLDIKQDGSNYYRFEWQGSAYSAQGVYKVISSSTVDSSTEAGTVDTDDTDYSIEAWWTSTTLRLDIGGTTRQNIGTSNTTEITPTSFLFRNNQINQDWKTIFISKFESTTPSSTLGSEEIGTGPLAFWKFDEGVGTTIYDSTQNRNNGTFGTGSSAPSWQNESMCVSGKCLKFDNTLKYAQVNDDNSLDIDANDFTISGWIKPQNDASSSIISKKRQNLIKYSQDFQSWSAYCGGGTIDTDTLDTTAPDGTFTAEKLTALDTGGCGDGVSGFLQTDGGLPSGKTYTASVWLKGAVGGEQIQLGLSDGVGRADIYLTTSWVRYSYTKTAASSISRRMQFFVYNDDPQPTFYAWGALLEVGSEPSQYVRSTSSYLDEAGYQVWLEGNTLKTIIGNTNKSVVSSTTGITANQWQHIALTYDRSGNLTHYIDGQAIGTTSVSSLSAESLTGGSDLFLGNTGTTELYNAFLGFIDEIKIYPYTRTANQIKADYNSGKAGLSSDKGSSVILGTSSGGNNLSDGLVGYWKMDEASWNGSVNEVIDSSGNANHGVGAGNTKPTTDAGKFGNGGEFDGVSQYIDITNESFSVSQPWSFSMWQKIPNGTNQSWAGFLGTYTGTNGGYWFYHSGGKLSWYQDYYNSTYYLWTSSLTLGTQIPYDQWFQTTVINEPIDSTHSKVTAYINGGQYKNSTTMLWSPRPTTNITFGTIGGAGGRYYQGLIDEVRIYNRTLSDSEVRQLYNWAPGPVAYYNFDKGVGTTAFDTSGNSNNGVLTNSPLWANGKYGGGIKLDGNNDSVEITDTTNSPLDMSEQVTIGAWFKVLGTPLNGYHVIAQKDGGYSGGAVYGIRINDSGSQWYPYGMICSGTGVSDCTTLSATTKLFNTNEWHYFTMTYNRSQWYLYMDGVLATSNVGETRAMYVTNGNFSVGSGDARYANGIVDEVKVYNYARTQKQITEDMNAGHPIGGSPVGSQTGYWKFDEDYGTTANNSGSAGSSINCTLGTGSSAPSWTNNGKVGKALSFTSSENDYIDCGNNSSLQVTETTWSAWIKPSSIDAYNVFLDKKYNKEGTFRLVNGRLHFYHGNGSDYEGFYGTTYLSSNNWYYVAVTRDTATEKISFYLNGKPDKPPQSYSYSPTTGTDNLFIGKRDGYSQSFNGLIDEVKIYNSALTADQVKFDYNQGKAAILGSSSSNTGSTAPGGSAAQEYCVPGSTDACSPPVAEWKLDEKTGSYAYDTSGNGNKGTLTNMESSDWKSAGQCHSGSCLEFDGDNEYVNVPHVTSIAVAGSITIEAWVYHTESQSGDHRIVSKDASTDGYVLYLNSDNIAGKVGDGSNCYLNSSVDVPLNSWQHLAMTADGSDLRLYLNEKKVDSKSCGSVQSNTVDLAISRHTGGSQYFNGLIDQVRIYNYARTPAQVAWDYNRGKPIGHWKLDECQGTIAYDSSGIGNTGNINIGPSGPQTSAGTCATASTAWGSGSTGKYSASLNFDGTDDYVNIANSSSLNFGNNDFSISFYTYRTATGLQGGSYLKKGNYTAGIDTYDRIFRVNTNTGELAHIALDATQNQWEHHIFTVTQNSTPYIKHYIDGIFNNSGYSEVGNLGTFNSDSYDLRIGHSTAGGVNRYFNGQIDDVKIFNYALTSDQIKVLYNDGAVSFK